MSYSNVSKIWMLATAVITLLTVAPTSISHALTVGPDVMVSPAPVPDEVWYNTAQAEPSVAVNPLDPNNIIVAYADFSLEPPCFFDVSLQHTRCRLNSTGSLNGLAVSIDGGTSWSQSILPNDPTANITSEHADVIVAFGPLPQPTGGFQFLLNGAPAARTYYMSLSNVISGAPQWNVNLYTSDDKGTTWSAPHIISIANAFKEKGFIEDKPYFTVDANRNSPTFGHAYLAYTNFVGAGSTGQVMFQSSDNGGVTWSRRQIVAVLPLLTSNPDVQIATGPGGEVYITYETADAIFISTSLNGGKSFGLPVKVADNPFPLNLASAGALPGVGARSYGDPSPNIVVHPMTGTLMVAFTSLTYDPIGNVDHGVLRYTTSNDRGARWSTPQTLVDIPGLTVALPNMAIDQLATSGKNVFIGYLLVQEHPVGTPQGADTVQRTAGVLSTDGGLTFGPNFTISSADSNASVGLRRNFDTGFMGDYNFSTFDAQGKLHYVWTDSRNGSNCPGYWAFVATGGTLLPFDLYAQCPASNVGDTDIYHVTIVP